ncbi:MAG: type I toxin-antitoxin system SymE family toxin [Saccharofermentans sp.]|jgi:toxic protein SymE|nr:type I toxin-antitoxin system SymE family toxin [Mageeibacillus sp.]MCI1275394.1 type I toxin-antitoxin system SymE family toxin [Saccharofermentans sp.]MCI1768751.1 type I toxin-antitoxin system SymE family toxin [Mageeibacillus sp.]
MKVKANRALKVYESSGYHYKPTPTIILKGQWLEQFGFAAGDNVDIHCEDGKLVVTKATDDSHVEL